MKRSDLHLPETRDHARRYLSLLLAIGALCCSGTARGQSLPPDYDAAVLEYIYPAGGQRGTSVAIQLNSTSSGAKGGGLKGLDGVLGLVIDGPPGITVRDVANASPTRVTATLDIASDAPLGRRMIRVSSRNVGLTNFCYFTVGDLPERVETEKNDEASRAEEVQLPLVMNGRIGRTLDVDYYRFEASKGQRIAAVALSHWIDSRGRRHDRTNSGYADLSMELLDAAGRVLAASEDALGLDPLIDYTVTEPGTYTLRVQMLGFKGFEQAVYRLAAGDLPLATSVHPAGGRQGDSIDMQLAGPGVPANASMQTLITSDANAPLTYLVPRVGERYSPIDLPIIHGTLAEQLEAEPNNSPDAAQNVEWPLAINGRFESAGDRDCYSILLEKGQKLRVDVIAQQYLRAPVDTVLEVLDDTGARVQNNDDRPPPQRESPHDVNAFDSSLELTAKKSGLHTVVLADQSGTSDGRAIYRLTISAVQPDFRLELWPDAVPIWGPGTTAAFVVNTERLGGLKGPIELQVVDLPPGWQGSSSFAFSTEQSGNFDRTLLTVTAPSDAKVGDMVTLRVVGRAEVDGRTIEHEPQPLSAYFLGDPGIFRDSPVARAAVAEPHGFSLHVEDCDISAKVGEELEIAVRVQGDVPEGKLPLNINRTGGGNTRCSYGAPLSIEPARGMLHVPLKVDLPPGVHGLVIARGWTSDVRGGMPGPCTPVIRLHVTEK